MERRKRNKWQQPEKLQFCTHFWLTKTGYEKHFAGLIIKIHPETANEGTRCELPDAEVKENYILFILTEEAHQKIDEVMLGY